MAAENGQDRGQRGRGRGFNEAAAHGRGKRGSANRVSKHRRQLQ